jgi:hypothetical protein
MIRTRIKKIGKSNKLTGDLILLVGDQVYVEGWSKPIEVSGWTRKKIGEVVMSDGKRLVDVAKKVVRLQNGLGWHEFTK